MAIGIPATVDLLLSSNYFTSRSGNYKYALHWVNYADSLAKIGNYKKGLAQAYRAKANLFKLQQNKMLAIENFKKALDLTYQLKDTSGIRTNLIELGREYGESKQITLSINCFTKALVFNTKDKNKEALKMAFQLKVLKYKFIEVSKISSYGF